VSQKSCPAITSLHGQLSDLQDARPAGLALDSVCHDDGPGLPPQRSSSRSPRPRSRALHADPAADAALPPRPCSKATVGAQLGVEKPDPLECYDWSSDAAILYTPIGEMGTDQSDYSSSAAQRPLVHRRDVAYATRSATASLRSSPRCGALSRSTKRGRGRPVLSYGLSTQEIATSDSHRRPSMRGPSSPAS